MMRRLRCCCRSALAFLTLQFAIHVWGEGEEQLFANRPLDRQVARLDGDPARFRLEDLKAHTSYEVRVSYPATIPATIKLRLVGKGPVRLRRLLETEKLIFRTDASARPQGLQDAVVELQARGRFVHRDGPASGPLVLVYNIVCQSLVHGAVPSDALPVIAVCLLLGGVVWISAPFFSQVLVPRLLRWVLHGSSSSSGGGGGGGGGRYS